MKHHGLRFGCANLTVNPPLLGLDNCGKGEKKMTFKQTKK